MTSRLQCVLTDPPHDIREDRQRQSVTEHILNKLQYVRPEMYETLMKLRKKDPNVKQMTCKTCIIALTRRATTGTHGEIENTSESHADDEEQKSSNPHTTTSPSTITRSKTNPSPPDQSSSRGRPLSVTVKSIPTDSGDDLRPPKKTQAHHDHMRRLELEELYEKGFESVPIDPVDVATVDILDRPCAESHLLKVVCVDEAKKRKFYAERTSNYSLFSASIRDRNVLFSCRCSRVHYSPKEPIFNHIALRHSSQTWSAATPEETISKKPTPRKETTTFKDYKDVDDDEEDVMIVGGDVVSAVDESVIGGDFPYLPTSPTAPPEPIPTPTPVPESPTPNHTTTQLTATTPATTPTPTRPPVATAIVVQPQQQTTPTLASTPYTPPTPTTPIPAIPTGRIIDPDSARRRSHVQLATVVKESRPRSDESDLIRRGFYKVALDRSDYPSEFEPACLPIFMEFASKMSQAQPTTHDARMRFAPALPQFTCRCMRHAYYMSAMHIAKHILSVHAAGRIRCQRSECDHISATVSEFTSHLQSVHGVSYRSPSRSSSTTRTHASASADADDSSSTPARLIGEEDSSAFQLLNLAAAPNSDVTQATPTSVADLTTIRPIVATPVKPSSDSVPMDRYLREVDRRRRLERQCDRSNAELTQLRSKLDSRESMVHTLQNSLRIAEERSNRTLNTPNNSNQNAPPRSQPTSSGDAHQMLDEWRNAFGFQNPIDAQRHMELEAERQIALTRADERNRVLFELRHGFHDLLDRMKGAAPPVPPPPPQPVFYPPAPMTMPLPVGMGINITPPHATTAGQTNQMPFTQSPSVQQPPWPMAPFQPNSQLYHPMQSMFPMPPMGNMMTMPPMPPPGSMMPPPMTNASAGGRASTSQARSGSESHPSRKRKSAPTHAPDQPALSDFDRHALFSAVAAAYQRHTVADAQDPTNATVGATADAEHAPPPPSPSAAHAAAHAPTNNDNSNTDTPDMTDVHATGVSSYASSPAVPSSTVAPSRDPPSPPLPLSPTSPPVGTAPVALAPTEKAMIPASAEAEPNHTSEDTRPPEAEREHDTRGNEGSPHKRPRVALAEQQVPILTQHEPISN